MRRLLFALLPLVAASNAGAQIIRQRFGLREPSTWISGGVGTQDAWSVTDGKSGAHWQFGNSTQYAASLEKAISTGASIGIRGTTATVPLTYAGVAGTTDADANVSQLFGVLHVASPGQFHTVFELSAGATVYSNFKARVTNAKLPPDQPDPDFSFALGYGFGYALSSTFSVDLVQDLTTSMHQNVGLSAGDDTSVRWRTTRIVARIGLGGR